MGILGLLLGVAFVTVIRALQGLDPVQDASVSLVLGGFVAVGFFMWGLGAFDPRMSEHAHDPEHAEQLALALAEEEAKAPPGSILGSYIWLLTTGLLLLLVVIVTFALIPGSPALQTTSDPLGNAAANGFVEMQILGHTIIVSQLLLLIGFAVVMFATLALAAGGLGFVLFALNRGVTEVAGMPRTALGPGPLAEEEAPAASAGPLARLPLRAAALALGTLAVTVVLDLVVPFEPGLRVPSFSYILATFALLVVFTLAAWALLSAALRAVRGWLWLVRALIVLVVVGAFVALYAALVTSALTTLDLLPLAIINALLLAALVFTGQTRGVLFAALGAGLFVAFYYVLIGLVLVGAPDTLFWLSLVNAAVIALVVLRPRQVTNAIGGGARALARWLRRLPYWING
jgi:hypothetical protein